MIFWLISIAFLALFGFCLSQDKKRGRTEWSESTGTFFFLFAASALILLSMSIVNTLMVLSYQVNLDRIDKDLVVAEAQFTGMQEVIQSYSDKYPLEKPMFANGLPPYLLKLPELQSSEFLAKQTAAAVEFKKKIYDLQFRKNEMQKDLDWHSHRWASLTLIAPTYKK